MDKIALLAAKAALKKLFDQGHFSITTINEVAAALGLPKPSGRSYLILRSLHCVDYSDMEPELRKQLVPMIADCLGDGVGGQFRSDVMALVGVTA